MIINKLLNIFKEFVNYKYINNISETKLRNNKNGININDAVYYEFSYTNNVNTKNSIVSYLNNKNNTTFKRQSFDSKSNNIPVKFYFNLFNKLRNLYNLRDNLNDNCQLLAIDGTYNNNKNVDELMNLGIFNVSTGIPIDIHYCGIEGKNREIKYATKYITNNIDIFKNNIIVADRAYFSYVFINFLIKNNIKFIIRIKNDGKKIKNANQLQKSYPNYHLINDIQNTVRIINYEQIINKIIFNTKSKKKNNKYNISIKNDCTLLTNLLDTNEYTDDKIMHLYNKRWDIEVFFKLIKNNFKFQYINSNETDKFKKMYLCELIIIYISKILESYYKKKYNLSLDNTIKINKSHLIKGIYTEILYNLLLGTLQLLDIDKFIKSYIITYKNEKNRSFPRNGKVPFTKWYIKGYSNHTKIMQIINAIDCNKINDLNKNLKSLSTKIIKVYKCLNTKSKLIYSRNYINKKD